jgi:hypothetical protein
MVLEVAGLDEGGRSIREERSGFCFDAVSIPRFAAALRSF